MTKLRKKDGMAAEVMKGCGRSIRSLARDFDADRSRIGLALSGAMMCIPEKIRNECLLVDRKGLTRMIHQNPAPAHDILHSATFPSSEVLDVPSSTPPRLEGRKRHCAQNLETLASNPGE